MTILKVLFIEFKCVLFLTLISIDLNAQNLKGIHFEKDLTWHELIEKAKSENKYIFLDCFATWCGPCQAMDKDVYVDEDLGKFVNDKFISVKVQMDKQSYDNDHVKSWYDDALVLEKEYSITAYPTFLFFFPDGKPMHKAVGFKDPNQFKSEIDIALDPKEQYYSVLANFRPGKMDTSELKKLAYAFNLFGKELAYKIAADYLNRIPSSELSLPDNIQFMEDFMDGPDIQKIALSYLKTLHGLDISLNENIKLVQSMKNITATQNIVLRYINNLSAAEFGRKENLNLLSVFKNLKKAQDIANSYINSLDQADLYTKDNLEFISTFTQNSIDKGFSLFYKHASKVDSVMTSNDYAQSLTDNIINKEEVSAQWQSAIKGEAIDWKKIYERIKSKYNEGVAYRIVLNSKVNFYKYMADHSNKNWPEYIKCNIIKIEKYGTDTSSVYSGFYDATLLNNFAFDIFQHSNNKKQLSMAMKWQEGVIRRSPKDANNMDTYANLLYKTGQNQVAIKWEEKALETAVKEKQDWTLSEIQENLAKMKSGKPTWIVPYEKKDLK